MKKYTANYTYTNPNFVIQNLVTNQTNVDLLPILYVIKNILQRGFPTTLSKYLQSQLGEITNLTTLKNAFCLRQSRHLFGTTP
jgi:ATP-dependent DNA helicase RecQ